MNTYLPSRVFIAWIVGAFIAHAMMLSEPGRAGSSDKHRASSQLGLSLLNYVVLFDPGSSRLTASARLILDQVAQDALRPRQDPDMAISLVGHTDTIGDAESNRRLSCRRAIAARDYLVSAGVARDRILVEGRGEAELAVPTADEREKVANRRVVVIFDSGSVRPEWACDGS